MRTLLDASDFNSIKKEISKCLEENGFEELLALMESLKNWKATTETLKKFKIGVFVTEIRRHQNATEKVKQLSKEIILKWKKDVGRTSISVKTEGSSKPTPSAQTMSASSSTEFVSTQERNVTLDSVHVAQKDKIRRKCTEILYSALATGSELPSEDILEIAESIETVAFQHFKSVSDQYKAKLRSLVSNLRDKNNPMLRHKVLSGSIPSEKFALMTAEEMMSKDRKAIVEEAQKANLKDTLSAKPTHAATDIFKCGRCKERKCTYYQMQTRSADEPMTTFVTCLVCDNRWKFC